MRRSISKADLNAVVAASSAKRLRQLTRNVRSGLREATRRRAQIDAGSLRRENGLVIPPYPFCRTPLRCDGAGYCRRDPACNN